MNVIDQFVDYALDCGLIAPEDESWARNALLEMLGLTGCEKKSFYLPFSRDVSEYEKEGTPSIDELLDTLTAIAKQTGRLNSDASFQEEDQFATRIMGMFMPRPSELAAHFHDLEALDPALATSWFYRLSVDARYVRKSAIARNRKWKAATLWGELDITINLSKPEKDPRAIAAAAHHAPSQTDITYPRCQICMENEGYSGRFETDAAGAHPARQNLRIIPLVLEGEPWGLQYSPYAYFPEHCIVMSKAHRPMHIDETCFRRLIAFVDRFPHYFIGSNADLPIVGGSILNHDHFQGGRTTFPMDDAPVETHFELDGYPQVSAGIVYWPLTVIRLESKDAEQIVQAATHVLEVWQNYDNPEANIFSHSEDGTPHNTVTPIARKQKDTYILQLALRCNITTADRPLGLFHPRPSLFHIKRENIGLIEVMGLAILPPRLAPELDALEQMLQEVLDTDKPLNAFKFKRELEASPLTARHAQWAVQLAQEAKETGSRNAHAFIERSVGKAFGQVLEDAGVFKWTAQGRASLGKFLKTL